MASEAHQPIHDSNLKDGGNGGGGGPSYEQEFVHDVYESIASHFSQTRYKPWPIVADFLNRQPIGSIGLDLGSGNGKYLHGHNITKIQHPTSSKTNSSELPIGAKSPGLQLEEESRYFMLGLDRSFSLLSLSQNSNSFPELIHGDCLSLPFRSNLKFDFIISIATLHHLSTSERRLQAMKLLLSSIKPSSPHRIGRALVFVWAHEQGEKSRRNWSKKGTLLPATHLLSSTEPFNSEINNKQLQDQKFLSSLQDVLVPWTLNHPVSDPSDSNRSQSSKTFNRYYHLFRQGELIQLVRSASDLLQLSFRLDLDSPPESSSHQKNWCFLKRHGWEADNWWVEIEVGCVE